MSTTDADSLSRLKAYARRVAMDLAKSNHPLMRITSTDSAPTTGWMVDRLAYVECGEQWWREIFLFLGADGKLIINEQYYNEDGGRNDSWHEASTEELAALDNSWGRSKSAHIRSSGYFWGKRWAHARYVGASKRLHDLRSKVSR